jgi:hypothetical protein
VSGILTIDAAAYHADGFGEQPSLSSSIARVLVSQSPKHAWTAHPRLNPDYRSEEKEAFDIGTIAHALLLEDGADVAVLPFDDWRKKDAQEARKEAREAGRTPLLEKHWQAVTEMVAATRRQLDALDADPAVFADGLAEQTLVWDDHGVACRARLDWLRDDRATIDDYKTSSRSANPEQFSRSLFSMGYDVQAAFYRRGLLCLAGSLAEFRFVVQETFPPYALSVVTLGAEALALADEKVQYAIDLWRKCLAADRWPAYPTRVCVADLPSYEETRWLAREEAA